MHGIECIEAVLQHFAWYTLSSAVKPYGYQSENRICLSGYLDSSTENLCGYNLTLKENDIDAHHTDKLTEPCKWEISENIENHHHKHTVKAVVNKAEYWPYNYQQQPKSR